MTLDEKALQTNGRTDNAISRVTFATEKQEGKELQLQQLLIIDVDNLWQKSIWLKH